MKEKLQKERESSQTTDTVVMIYPDTFSFNPETASDNKFMKPLVGYTPEQVHDGAIEEFENAVAVLNYNKLNVLVVHSPEGKDTPDAVFPNNWFSLHRDVMVLYPMRNTSRSIERQPNAILNALAEANIETPEILDFSFHEKNRGIEIVEDKEKQVKFEMSVCLEALEGTGSMVLDRTNRISYAIESPRTTKAVFDEWCKEMDYAGVFFHAENEKGPIYHTNVIMGIGEKFAVICLDSVKDENEKMLVKESLEASGKEVIQITQDQVAAFCGNLLEVKTREGSPLIVMSKTASDNFSEEQLWALSNYGRIVSLNIPIIEHAGGSARCIMAEVFHN